MLDSFNKKASLSITFIILKSLLPQLPIIYIYYLSTLYELLLYTTYISIIYKVTVHLKKNC